MRKNVSNFHGGVLTKFPRISLQRKSQLCALNMNYELFGFLSYGYPDGVALREGVSLREGVAFLGDEELLVVELGVDEEEDPLTLSFLNTNELN